MLIQHGEKQMLFSDTVRNLARLGCIPIDNKVLDNVIDTVINIQQIKKVQKVQKQKLSWPSDTRSKQQKQKDDQQMKALEQAIQRIIEEHGPKKRGTKRKQKQQGRQSRVIVSRKKSRMTHMS